MTGRGFGRDRSLLPGATEEFLRVYPPARSHARTVAKDCEFGGQHLARGDRVLLSEVSACHDERAFPSADGFVIDRFPNRHLAFGLGIHRCPGSHLARAQFFEIMSQVLDRLPDYSVDAEGIVEYPELGVHRGMGRHPGAVHPGPAPFPGHPTARRGARRPGAEALRCGSGSTSLRAPATPSAGARGPDVFVLDELGFNVTEPGEVPLEKEEQARRGAAACPEQAITVEE